MWRFLRVALLCAGTTSAAAADAPWVALTLGDLKAVHDTLRENHPAPVDTSPDAAPYKRWLEDGLLQAKARAVGAHSFEEYQRVIQFYVNGFRDGHISTSANVDTTVETWPGFVLGGTSADDAVVVSAREDAGVKAGDRLISCDDRTVDALLKERTDPYYWNADIPHARFAQLYRLFYESLSDPQPKLEHCMFASGPVNLSWRTIRMMELQPILQTARGRGARELRIQKIGDVWLISIPTFSYLTHDDTEKARAFAAALSAHALDFENATIVIDVRGNGGGDSGWGKSFAAALWGKDWVDRIERQFDDTVDWRVTKKNIAALETTVAHKHAEQEDSFTYWNGILTGMKAAMAQGKVYYREESPAQPVTGPAPADALHGHIYLFTDAGCASACLDFADLMTRLPGVTQIGLPTYADALYIDNNTVLLPSGLTSLNYGMKVYRHRARGNNKWYEPKVRWPGGPVTDEAIARWAATLAQTR